MVAARLTAVRERIAAAARRAGRDPGTVRLVAVTKGVPAAVIAEAVAAGQTDFGENRAGELTEKARLLAGHGAELSAAVRWHFVGHLQRNKVRRVRPLTALLHSLDGVRLARAWAGDGPAPPALIQVNVAGEAQKHGVAAEQAGALLAELDRLGIPAAGLMTIAPLRADPEAVRPVFAALARLGDELRRARDDLAELSMGMTDDFEVAVEEGATMLRIGRAIFGATQGPGTGPTATDR